MITLETIYWIIFAVPSILIASTIHEYAHGWMAFKLGDATAKAEGRLTLNPIPHIDPVGALCMIFFRFGWSKPVPINEYNFRNREQGTALTALAGPLSNIVVAIICGGINLLFKLDSESILGTFLLTFTMINLALAFFNLLPVPPLDGHKIIRAILPKRIRFYWEEMEKFSIIFLILIIAPLFSWGSLASIYIVTAITRSLAVLGFL